MTSSWVQRAQNDDPTQFERDTHPVVERVLRNRGVVDSHTAALSLAMLPHPSGLFGCEAAIAKLAQAHSKQKSILIVGDFDCDGASATALCLLALRAMGFAEVGYLAPNRLKHPYGLSPELLEEIDAHNYDLILTVDNGISAFEGVQAAKKRGLEVIISDHHRPSSQLPNADAIVNPWLANHASLKNGTDVQPERSPYLALSGTGVAFYLLAGLRAHLHQQRPEITLPSLEQWLDLVALGTLSDMVPLNLTNRILVQHGLRLFRALKCRPGLVELMQARGIEAATAGSSTLAYDIIPLLNAAGRLADIALAIDLLTHDDPKVLALRVSQLTRLNDQRRHKQRKLTQLAEEQIPTQQGKHSVCIYHEQMHSGLSGLIASQLVRRYTKPVVIFAPSEQEGHPNELVASARAPQGAQLSAWLDHIHSQVPGLLKSHGGHAQAAGLRIDRSHFKQFAALFERIAAQSTAATETPWHSDGSLEQRWFCCNLVTSLERLSPWGTDFPKPLFDDFFIVHSVKKLKNITLLNLEKADLTETPELLEAVLFETHKALPQPGAHIHLVYELQLSRYVVSGLRLIARDFIVSCNHEQQLN